MTAYLLKRLALLLVTLLGITFVSFGMLQLAPGSPIEMKLRQGVGGSMSSEGELTEEIKERLRAQYNFDKPIVVQYWLWLKKIVVLDFGNSFHGSQEPVIDIIARRLPVSLVLGITGILVAVLLGIPLGVLSARFQGGWLDFLWTFMTTAAFALPSYVLGILLIVAFANPAALALFPPYGTASSNYENLSAVAQFFDVAWHFVLPCFCYSIGGLAMISQQQRNALIESLGQDYIRTARAKGLSDFVVTFKHAFRNSLIPTLTMFAGLIPSIVGSSVIIEYLFSIDGLGALMLKALFERDYPIIMASFTIGALLTLIGILFSDIMYTVADPRIDFDR